MKRALQAAAVAVALAGCTSAPPPAANQDYKSRAVTRTEGGVRVSTAVLSADESATVYGVPLAEASIQPVWIEVENREDRAYYLLSPGLDPNFFPASEASEAFASDESSEQRVGLDRRFRELAFRNPILPGSTTSGFVLTNLDEGFKFVQIDLVTGGRARTFSILAIVPGFRADYRASEVFRREIYPPEKIVDYTDDAAFRAALEALPCCATNEDGSKNGDPLNLVIVGGLDDAFPAFARRGWRPTELKWSGSIMKMVTSALVRRALPVRAGERPLPVRPRPGPRIAEGARQRPPAQPPETLAQPAASPWQAGVGRPDQPRHRQPGDDSHADVHDAQDRSRRRRGPHRLDAGPGLLPEHREDRLREGGRAAPKSAPRGNLTTDPYYTDGLRSVLVFEHRPTSLARSRILPLGIPAREGDRACRSMTQAIGRGAECVDSSASALCAASLWLCARRLCDVASSR